MASTKLDATFFDNMKSRCIGLPRGERVLAVAGHPTEAMTFYFGACTGGVWKSEDGGVYWENISDSSLNISAIGAIAPRHLPPATCTERPDHAARHHRHYQRSII